MCELSNIMLTDEIPAVMVTGFEDKIFKLFCISVWCVFSYFFGWNFNGFPLICLFTGENFANILNCKISTLIPLFHFNGLRIRRCAIVHFALLQDGILFFVAEIGQSLADHKRNFALVHQIKQFGDKVRQTDITENLIFTVSGFCSYLFNSKRLLPKLGRSY